MTAEQPRARPIRALVVDDERPARELIKSLLRQDAEIVIAAEARSGDEAVAALKERTVDLVFLDIQLPDFDGFDVLRQVGTDNLPYIVFVTAHDDYALRAFEVHALDYLLKPYSRERFYKSVQRAKAAIQLEQVHSYAAELTALLADRQRGESEKVRPLEQTGHLAEIRVKDGKKHVRVDVHDIVRIESADHYVKLHTGGRSYIVQGSISGFEAQLDPNRFVRVHRTTIVNVDRIRELRSIGGGNYAVVMRDGSEVRIGRSHRDKLAVLMPPAGD